MRALALTRCVDRSARTAGMSRESAYRLRRRKGAESFAAAWDSVLAAHPRGVSEPSLIAHRAFYGTPKPVIRGGEVVGMVVKPDNKALLTLFDRVDRLVANIAKRERSR
jgi:hypothetical protein